MSKVKYYTDKNFIRGKESCLFHGFFTRKGGISEGLYAGLNCGIGSGDNQEHTDFNRNIVAVEAGVSNEKLLSLYQVHGSKVVTVDKIWEQVDRPHADGIVTDKIGVALTILTADCAPVLFHGCKENGSLVIGAAHAGWGGALKGVLDSTVDAMQALGADILSIKACVGPCISQISYEVGMDFVERFVKESAESERFFRESVNENHYMFDLSGYCAWRLARKGIKDVSLVDIDTYSNEDEFYSFRRSTHRKESGYGRHISVISIKNDRV